MAARTTTVIVVVAYLLIHQSSCVFNDYCQNINQSCNEERQRNQSKWGTDDHIHHVTITTIFPLTDCYSTSHCQLVDYRIMDVVGLQSAIQSLVPPSNFCVNIVLCDSSHDPIKALDIMGSYDFHETCDDAECPPEKVCFSECSHAGTPCSNHIAVIGPGTPQEGKALADLTSSLGIPQLLYSTGSAFTDRKRYDYLHQIAPSYQRQVDRIIDIITDMDWRYIAVITTADTYGKIGYELLKSKFDAKQKINKGVEKNCCLQLSTTMLTFRMEFLDIEAQLRILQDKTTVIVLWMEGKYAEKVFDYFRITGRKDTVYIAPDGWALDTRIHDRFKKILSNRFIGLFPDFGVQVDNQSVQMTLNHYDQDRHPLEWDMLNKSRKFVEESDILGYSGGVMTSLKTLYQALEEIKVSNDASNRAFRQIINEKLKELSVRQEEGILVYTMAAEGKLSLVTDRSGYPSDIISRCSEPCKSHQYAVLLKKRPRCCFTCKSCSANSIVKRDGDIQKCQECASCQKPSENRTVCVAKNVAQFSILNGDGFSVSVFLVSVLGIFCNMFVVITLARHSTTPIVKASSPQLCYIMLVSLMLLLTAPVLMVLGPGDVTCPLQRYIIGMGIVIPIAVLFARSNRINFIFNRTSFFTGSLQKMVMSVKYNVLLIAFLAAIQFCICAILHAHHEQSYDGRGKIHVKTLCTGDVTKLNFVMCNEDRMDLVYMWIGYICVLILATTFVSFKTRRLPTNFNEARYICLVMFVILVVTICTISTYIVLDSQLNIMYQCWSIIIAVYAILIIVYGQKMYVIYVIPDQNRRQDTNVALERFLKRTSENRMSSYSQLLIRPTRLSTTDSLSLNSNSKPATPTPASKGPWRSVSVGETSLKALTATERRALFKRSSASSEHGQRKLTGDEKRAIFRSQKKVNAHRRTRSAGCKFSNSHDRDLDPLASIRAELGMRFTLGRSSSD